MVFLSQGFPGDLIFSFRVPCPRTPRRKSGPRSPDRQGLSKGKCRQRARVSPQNSARPPPDKSKSRGAPTSDKEPHHNKHCGFQCRHQGKREQLLRLSAPQARSARDGCRFATRRADFHVPHGVFFLGRVAAKRVIGGNVALKCDRAPNSLVGRPRLD